MSGFRAVNTNLSVTESAGAKPEEEIKTPTTPRQMTFFDDSADDSQQEDASAKTPTRDSFIGLAGQKPLPDSPFKTPAKENGSTAVRSGAPKRDSLHLQESSNSPQDVDMEDDEEDDPDGSDDESVSGDGSRPSKKKKSQRFFCVDFPPCQLSFTRSEHLARHIRKHTGERPFQCHCSRRFSRLDNLRQHAQTVHVNEEIPTDSLAATGTRFQRQIRTDRVRPPSNRSRASTLGSSGTHSRGHSRNLSTSSITSTSSIGSRDDSRRRPQPLAMAGDGTSRARLGMDGFGSAVSGSQFHGFVPHHTSGFSTPTSVNFPSDASSPRFAHGVHSPSSPARPVTWGGAHGSQTTARRLSVPSATPLFQSPPGPPPYPPGYGPEGPTPPHPHQQQQQQQQHAMYRGGPGPAINSPTGSTFSDPRGDEADWRRRTWHPGTYGNSPHRPSTSDVSYYPSPHAPQHVRASALPIREHPMHQKLPGIESFDRMAAAPPPAPPMRRAPSPMQLDSPTKPVGFAPHMGGPGPTVREEQRKGHISWDAALHTGINNLDIASTTPVKEQRAWLESPSQPQPQQAHHHHHHHHQHSHSHSHSHSQSGQHPPTISAPNDVGRPPVPTTSAVFGPPIQQTTFGPPRLTNHVMSDPPVTSRKNKRLAWYHGPVSSVPGPPPPSAPPVASQPHQQGPLPPSAPAPPQVANMRRASPEDSSSSESVPTPSTASIMESHPAIVQNNGVGEASQIPAASYSESLAKTAPSSQPGDMRQAMPVPAFPPPSSDASQAYGARPPTEMPPAPPLAYPAPAPPPPPPHPVATVPQRPANVPSEQTSQSGDMRRLEALVAVATGENVG